MRRLISRAPLAVLAARAPLGALCLLGLLAIAGNAVAQSKTTYRWTDAQGVVHYSDTPQPGAQVIQLPSAQTYRAPPPPAAASKARSPDAPLSPDEGASAYQSCGISQPAAETSLFAPDTVSVAVQLAPGLRPGDQLAVTFDGAALEPTAPGGLQYQVSGPDRGAHTLSATVRDSDGKTVCRAAPVTFYVQRPSMLGPSSPVPKH